MAYLFGLAVECGGQKERATALLNHFSATRATLHDGQTVTFSSELHEEKSENGGPRYWAFVFANEFKSGAASAEIAASLGEAAHTLHERLRTAPPFRFALTGVEPLEAITFEQLEEVLQKPDFLRTHYPGFVISEDLTPTDQSADVFEPFAPGYLWIPYQGEKFRA